MRPEELIAMAEKAMMMAYAPYSGYFVGAALLTKSGKLYTGCNIENAAFSPSICAERTALFKAVSEGEREFAALAVCGGKHGEIKGAFPPCGVCRQALREFCSPEMPVYLDLGSGKYDALTLGDLLPYAFNAEENMSEGERT